jgi:hypothetical protein
MKPAGAIALLGLVVLGGLSQRPLGLCPLPNRALAQGTTVAIPQSEDVSRSGTPSNRDSAIPRVVRSAREAATMPTPNGPRCDGDAECRSRLQH